MRIRTVKPEFWTHPVMIRQSDFTKLLALALLNYSDDEGFFYADEDLIRGALFPKEDSTKIRRSIEDLSKIGYVSIKEHATHGDIGCIIAFSSHQRVDRPKQSIIKPLHASSNDLRIIDEASTQEGNREQGTGKGKEHVLLSDTGKPEIEQKVLGEFKVKGQKETWKLTEEHVNELKEAFSCIDIISECKKAKAWLSANPSKMKTSKGMKKFLFGWIERSNNSGRATFDQSNNGKTKPKSEGTRLYPEVIHEPRPVITEETKEMIDKLFNK